MDVVFLKDKRVMEKGSNSFTISQFFVHIIDILYAVVIGNGIVEISSKKYLNLPENWANLFSIEFFLFIFALFIVFRDLIKYNQEISKRPHKNEFRFILDIAILFVFFFLLKSYNYWGKYLFLLAMHFSLSFIWTVIEGREWRDEKQYKYSDSENLKVDLRLDIITGLYLLMVYVITRYFIASLWKISFLVTLGLLLCLYRPKNLPPRRIMNRFLSLFVAPKIENNF